MLLNNKKCTNCETYYDPTLKKCPKCYKSNELYLDREVSNNILFLHPFAQIGLFLAGFAYAGMLIAEFIFSFLLIGLDNDIFKSTILLLFTYLMMFSGLIVIPLTTRRQVFFEKYKRPLDYIYGVAYAFSLVFVSMVVSSILSLFHEVSDNANQSAAVIISHNYPLLAFLVIGILGPICEEFTYRVGLYSFLRRINKYLAFVVTVIVFAFIHFDFTSIGQATFIEEMWSLPSYLISGFLLTLAYEHRGPACSMTAHLTYNAFAFIMILVAK